MALRFTVLFFLICTCSLAQTKITGRVTDDKGVAIPGANVFLLDTYDGTSTDQEGRFEFDTEEIGLKVLTVKFVGYKEFRQEIELTGKLISIEIPIKEEINELEAVTITAGSFTASDESRRTIFRAVDIATTAGATADIAGALNTLPGTQKVGESGRLFVRGGEGNETRTFIDGLAVLDAYGPTAPNTPSRGRFLPFMFKGTSFSTGGYSAEYGQALSSALVLDSRDKGEMTRTDIGILSVGADLTHSQVWKRGSVAGKIQYTNIRPYFGLISQEVDWKTPPASVEGSTAFRQQFGKSGMLKVFGNFSRTDFSIYNHDIDDSTIKELFDLTNDYTYLNAFYKNALNENWTVRGGISYSYNRNNTFIDKLNLRETDNGIHSKIVFEGSLSDKIELRSGAEVIQHDHEQRVAPENETATTNRFGEIITAGFAEADLYTSNRFVTRTGIRAEHNNLNNHVSLDPRISLAYKTGARGQFSLAYGTFRQSPQNQWLRANNKLLSEKADHFILNYQLVNDNRTFRVETYYKRYRELIKFINGDETQLNNKGDGYAKGFEFFWRDNRTFKNTDYWFSYSFLDTERDYLNFPERSTPSFASHHNFSMVYKYFITDWKTQLGATYSFASGRPYNDPNEESFNRGKTPTYHDLSFNAAYLPRPNLILYFSCTNVLGRDNVFGYEFSDQLNDQGMYNSRAIRQPAKRFLFIGIFITFSKNKSVNQLPTL